MGSTLSGGGERQDIRFFVRVHQTNMSYQHLLSIWQAADRLGYDGASLYDLLAVPCLECWTTLATLIMATQRLRALPMVLAYPYRHPTVLAKMAATLDVVSDWITTARGVEELGYATLLMPDRTTIGSLAPLTALAVAAEATTVLRIGSFVFCNEYRHPVLLAREAATLDLLSEGRFELGLGAGVGPSEFQRMGIPFLAVSLSSFADVVM